MRVLEFWTLALVCVAGFAGLGVYVTHSPLSWPDTLFTRVFGYGVPIARFFTITGYARVVVAVLAVAALVCVLLRASLLPIVTIATLQALSQSTIVLVKQAFGRPRPDLWRFRAELGLSYPSGHATTAVVLYGLFFWLAYTGHEPLPVRALALGILTVWIVGICWSRIALGAHYPTDVLGGALIGAAFAFAGLALFHFV